MEKKKNRRRSNAQRADQVLEMAEMDVRGHSLGIIASKFGVSKSQVSRDLRKFYKSIENEQDKSKLEKRNKMIQEIRLAKRELWEAWELSKQDKEVQTREKATSAGDGVAQNGGVERAKASIRTEGRLPHCPYMAELGKCWEKEARLLGINDPEKLDLILPKPLEFINIHDAPPRDDDSPKKEPPPTPAAEQAAPPPPESQPVEPPTPIPPPKQGGLQMIVEER